MVAIALRRAVAILGLGLLAAVHASAQSVRTIPAQPRAQEDFLVVYGVGIGVPQRMFSSRATTTAGRIDVQARVEGGDSLGKTLDVLTIANVPAAGSYAVNAATTYMSFGETADYSASAASQPLGTITVAAATPAATPQWRTLSGLYLRADEPGWGLHVAQTASGKLFATWYTYDDDYSAGNGTAPSVWYAVSSGKWISPREFRGVLHDATGVPAGYPYESRHASVRPAGVATFRFLDEDRVAMSIEFAQASRFQVPQTLTRFRF